MQLVTAVRNFANHFGIHIVRAKAGRWSLEHYPEQRRPEAPLYVNVGAGSFYHPLWHNLDAPGDYYDPLCGSIDFRHDLTSGAPLPFNDRSVRLFYTSHVIEHLTDAEVSHLAAEMQRCLAPGGIVRITAPDMELQYDAYMRHDQGFWWTPSPWNNSYPDLERRFVEHFATGSDLQPAEIKDLAERLPMDEFFDAVTKTAPNGGPEFHRNWFTVEKLSGLLKDAGLTAKRSAYLQSDDRRMRDPRYFDATCPGISFYVEAKVD